MFKNYTPTQIHIYSGKMDYEQNLWKGKLGIGLKSALIKTDNDFKFYDVVNEIDTLNLNRSNHFVYTENVNAAYLNYARSIKRFSFQLGLRAEHTSSEGALSSAFPQSDDTVRVTISIFFPVVDLLMRSMQSIL
ncbi:MAG: outer membrane beta-barrel protein [Bacteroidetes bacterium]|nr:outer membrane beta-barrel protein [Bacteroidota bacterium]